MALTFQNKPPRDVPAKARVYTLLAPKVAATGLKTIARSLGIGADLDLLTSTDRLGCFAARWQVELYRASGSLYAVDRDNYGMDRGMPFKLSDRRAQRLSDTFLEQSKLIPLASARPLKVTHMRAADSDVKGENITERVLDAGVIYGRVVDGLPVTGPGGMAMINLDTSGAVVGVRSTWRVLGKPLGTVKIRPVEWAVASLDKATAGRVGEITVVKAQFGYFEFGVFDRQTVLEPVYAFVFVVQNGEVASKHVHVVHAGDRPYSRLLGQRRFPAAKQAPRRIRPTQSR